MSAAANTTEKETVILIGGMTCQSCVNHIESMLTQTAGVKRVRVGLELKFGFIRYDPSLTSPTSLAAVVDDIGFEASVDDCDTLSATWIKVSGMTCQTCVQHIEKMVQSVIGVRSVHVSLTDSLATVLYDSRHTSAAGLCGMINDIGFGAAVQPVMAGDNNPSGSHCATATSEVPESGDEFVSLAATRTNAGQRTCEISVEGMTCESCVRNIESTVSSVAGVVSVSVSLDRKKAVVVFNPTEISPETVAEKIDDMGFEAAVLGTHLDAGRIVTPRENGKPDVTVTADQTNSKHILPDNSDDDDDNDIATAAAKSKCSLRVTGMTCGSCVANIERHVRMLRGDCFVIIIIIIIIIIKIPRVKS